MREAVILLLLAIGTSSAITVGPVTLASGSQYITYQLGASEDRTLLQCPYKLEGSDVLKEISWIFSEDDQVVGQYTWNANDKQGTATGRLTDSVRLNREDGDLELTTLRYDLAGFYSCSAKTEENKEDFAEEWEVLIVDMTRNRVHEGLADDGPCKFKSSYAGSPVFPEPTLHSGLYSDSIGGFIKEVTAVEWMKQRYDNKSVAYSHKDVVFEIDEDTPYDVYFVNSCGVTKKDGSFIPLLSSKATISIFEERGCMPVKLDEYQQVTYNNGDKKTCRGEIALPFSDDLKATVSCMPGYVAAGHPEVTSVDLTCKTDTYQWTLPNNQPDLHNIKCREERGCLPVKLHKHQQVTYNNGNRRTNRNEMALPLKEHLKATVSCENGYKASGRPNVTSAELTCNTDSYEWTVPDDEPDLSDIKCVNDGTNGDGSNGDGTNGDGTNDNDTNDDDTSDDGTNDDISDDSTNDDGAASSICSCSSITLVCFIFVHLFRK